MSDTTEETPHHDPQPGILVVTSDTLSPDILSHETFNSWYITTHIPLVLSTAGKHISTATRYSHIPYSSTRPSHPLDPSISSLPRLSFLTIYSLNDTSFTQTPEFRSLGSDYTGPYLDAVFSNAEFDARCYDCHPPGQPPPAPSDPGSILLCAMMSGPPPPPPPESESEPGSEPPESWTMEQWFYDEHIPFFHTVTGYKRSRLYNFTSRHLLSKAEEAATSPRSAEWMLIHEFEGMRVPGIGFRDVESEMGRLREEVLSGRKEDGGKKKGQGKEKSEMEFSFWALTGQYWRKG